MSDELHAGAMKARQVWLGYHLKYRTKHAHAIALAEQAKDRSDPHVYGRIFSQLINGLFTPADFGVRA